MAKLQDLNVIIGLRAKGLRDGLSKVQRDMRNFARNTATVADAINKNITVPFAGASVAGSRFFLDVESNFAKIENLVGVTGDLLDEFKDGVKALSTEVGISQIALSDALFTVTSAGLRGSEAMEVLRTSAQASTVGLGDTKEIARATTAVLQAYGKENITAAQAANVLFNTVKEGNLEASELAPKLGDVIGLAAKMGVSFSEVGANVATFTRLGVDSASAITSLTGILSNFLAPGDQVNATLATIGMTAQDVRDSIAERGLAETLIGLMNAFEGNDEALGQLIPNIRALRGVLGVAGNQADDYLQIVNNLKNDTNGLSAAFDNASQGSGVKLRQAMIALQNAAIDLGAIVVPVVVSITERVTEWVKAFSALDEGTKTNIATTLAWVSGIGIGLKVMSSVIMTTSSLIGVVKNLTQSKTLLIAATKALNFVMNLNPYVLIATSVAALGAAITVAYKKSEKFRAVVAGLGALAQEVFAVIREAVGSFVQGWEALKDGDVAGALQGFAQGIHKSNPIGLIFGEGARLGGAFMKGYKDSLSAEPIEEEVIVVPKIVIPDVAGLVPDLDIPSAASIDIKMPGVTTPSDTDTKPARLYKDKDAKDDAAAIDKASEGIVKKSTDLTDYLKGLKPFSHFADYLPTIQEATAATFQKIKESVPVQAVLDMSTVMNDALMGMATGIGDAFGSILSGEGGLKDLGKAILMPLVNMIEQLGKMAISAGVAISGIRKAFMSLNPVAAIGAGVALLALAKVVKTKIADSVPKLALGGIALGEQLVTVGDNPSRKEAIIPLERMGEVMGMMGGGGKDVHVRGTFDFQRGALSAALEQDNFFRGRYR